MIGIQLAQSIGTCECMSFTYSIKVYNFWRITALLFTAMLLLGYMCSSIVIGETKLPKKLQAFTFEIFNFKFQLFGSFFKII